MSKNNSHPDKVFGPDAPPPVTFETIARQVRELEPRALTNESLDDVITIIEFMRTQCLDMHQANTDRKAALDERELTLQRREQALAVRQRAVECIMKVKPKRRYFWG